MDPKIIATWRDKLADLVERARVAAQRGTPDERSALAAELNRFTTDHPAAVPSQPETAEFDQMDQLADRTVDLLRRANIGGSVSSIAGNTGALQGAVAGVQGQTAANDATARGLRLEKARNVVTATTSAVTAIRELKAQVEAMSGAAGETAALADKLGKAVTVLQELRAAVETSG
jgi:hypothetical protein